MSEPTTPAPGAPAAPGVRADVIHDIGYRHYDGPRLGRGYATRSLYVQSLRGSFGLGRSGKSKILPMALLALMCLPALIIIAVVIYIKQDHLPVAVDFPHYLGLMTFVIAVFVASQAPVAVSRDLRFMTMPLYFSRPLTSSDYARAKFGAMATAVMILAGLPMVILWIGTLLAQMPFLHNLEHFGYGLLAAVFYSLVYAGIGLLIASLTPRRGFGVAAIIAVFLISSAVGGIIYGVVHDQGHELVAGWAAAISPSLLIDTTVNWISGMPERGTPDMPSALAGVVFLAEILLLSAASYGLLVRRYRKI
jgi:ABC-2 type transport system permease protein